MEMYHVYFSFTCCFQSWNPSLSPLTLPVSLKVNSRSDSDEDDENRCDLDNPGLADGFWINWIINFNLSPLKCICPICQIGAAPAPTWSDITPGCLTVAPFAYLIKKVIETQWVFAVIGFFNCLWKCFGNTLHIYCSTI